MEKKMTEKRDDIMLRENSMMHHLFIHSLSHHIPDPKELEAFLEEIGWNVGSRDANPDIETYLVVGTRKFPLKPTCEFWDKQIDDMVAKKAAELINEKLEHISIVAAEIEKKLREEANKALGLRFDEDGNRIYEEIDDTSYGVFEVKRLEPSGDYVVTEKLSGGQRVFGCLYDAQSWITDKLADKQAELE